MEAILPGFFVLYPIIVVMRSTRILLIAVFVFLTITVLFHVAVLLSPGSLPDSATQLSRWAFAVFFIVYSLARRSLSMMIIAGMVSGAVFGYDFSTTAKDLKVLSDIFLRLIKTIIAPLLFGTLVVGIAGHSDLKQVGRMGWKSLVYFEIVTTFALFIGLVAINLSQAGSGITVPADIAASGELKVAKPKTATEIILHIFPENFAKSVVEGEVLQIVVFSIIFAIGLAMVTKEKRTIMVNFAESLSETMFKFTHIIMYFAPIAVFGAIAYTTGNFGLGVFEVLGKLLATLYIALLVFVGVILIPIMLITRIPIRTFFRTVSEPATLAFATASSESAMPIAMERLVEMGVPKKIVAFVLPTGYSFNLDGTTLYLSLASVFVAQAANLPFTIGQQLLMVFTLMLTSKGVAGVPRASLVILLATVSSFGLPAWPVMLILGVDALMDMARTCVNVIGNCLAAAVVARWEGELVINHESNKKVKG